MAQRSNEEYKRAALALANASRQVRSRSVIVSSAVAGEGATTAAIFMGRHLRNDLGFTPVVMEVNSLRPALAKWFHFNSGKSLASAAEGSAGITDCIHKDPTGLAMIPVGTNGSGAGIPELEKLICHSVQELQNHFDFILLDAPPVLESADVLIAGRVVPNTILVVGAGRTSQQAVRQACRELRDARMQVVGSILNSRERILPHWLDRWMQR